MNKLKAIVKEIKTYDGVSIVSFILDNNSNEILKMMSLELSGNIKVGKKVLLGITSSNIAIAKSFSGELSYSNQLKVRIKEIINGELLSNIILENKSFILESIITKNSVLRMNLKQNDELIALIKASHISILEVLDD